MTGSTKPTSPVDQNELRTNQVIGSVLLLIAFILDRWEWVAIQASILFIATLVPSLTPYRLIYLYLLQPVGLLKPDLRNDRRAAHRFAMLLGFILTATATYLLAAGYSQIGWTLVWLVITLTAIAALGWCPGCFTYYTLNRLGLSRFFKYGPIACTIPGARPPKTTNHLTN